MQIQLLRGNPFFLILFSVISTIIISVLLIMFCLNGSELEIAMAIMVLLLVFINLNINVVLYILYRRSTYAFMSPKKYKNAIRQNEKLLTNSQKLKEALTEIDKKYSEINAEDALVRASELIRALNNKKAQG